MQPSQPSASSDSTLTTSFTLDLSHAPAPTISNRIRIQFKEWKHDLPAWIFFLALGSSLLALLIQRSSHESNLLLKQGWWWNGYQQSFSRWQPQGCYMMNYTAPMMRKCGQNPLIHFYGDSSVSRLFEMAAHRVNASYRMIPHHDQGQDPMLLHTWDPYLESVEIHERIHQYAATDEDRILVISGAAWFIKNMDRDFGMRAFSNSIEAILTTIESVVDELQRTTTSTTIYFLPMPAVVPQLLNEARKKITIERSLVYNAFLENAVETARTANEVVAQHVHFVPAIYQQSFEARALSEDGIHYLPIVYENTIDLILNHACNRYQSAAVSTCGTTYSGPSWKQVLLFVVLFSVGPLSVLLHRGLLRSVEFNSWAVIASSRLPETYSKHLPTAEFAKHVSVLFGSLVLIWLADRTSLFMKQQKHFDMLTFTAMTLASLLAGAWTLNPGKDDGFLNRMQTEEWKGWMQIAILIYHYTGASSVTGIYNAMRILVASYLFMTGYGHFTFFYKKQDFGVERVAKVLARLNLFTILLCYTMDSSYQAYYFSPLVTIWFLLIYTVMWIGHSYNHNDMVMSFKFTLLFAICFLLSHDRRIIEILVRGYALLTGTEWNAGEWFFRFTLDIYIVVFGMLVSFLSNRMHDRWSARLKEHGRTAGILGALGLVLYFVFELSCTDKFTYNVYHPFISIWPILSYVALRNSTSHVRRTTSGFFCFFGQISLETFIIQFHLWLAMDTKGLLVVFPGHWLLNWAVTSVLFVYVSHRVAKSSTFVTEWFTAQSSVPMHWKLLGVCVAMSLFNLLPK